MREDIWRFICIYEQLSVILSLLYNIKHTDMKLKNATLLAIVGISLLAFLKIYSIVQLAYIMDLNDIKYMIPEIVLFVGIVLVLPFLLVLYKNQK